MTRIRKFVQDNWQDALTGLAGVVLVLAIFYFIG